MQYLLKQNNFFYDHFKLNLACYRFRKMPYLPLPLIYSNLNIFEGVHINKKEHKENNSKNEQF